MSSTESEPGDTPEQGIFGNLPRTRPSVRSPRRAEALKPDPAPDPAPEDPSVADQPSREPAGEAEPDLEALAKAGLSLATGAASLGLKAAGRAAAALRDAVEKR